MPVTARFAACALAIMVAGCMPQDSGAAGIKERTMTNDDQVVLQGDGPDVRVDLAEIDRMGAALGQALADREMLARSGAPDVMLARLAGSYHPARITEGEEARAGRWLLVSAPEGPRWDLRLATPEGPRAGLLFQVPLARASAQADWRAVEVRFIRVRPAR